MRRIIEQVSGRSWEAFADERIFAPAEMKSTFFVGQPAPDLSRLATPYREDYAAFGFADAYEYYIPTAAGLFSKTGDLARFAQALTSGALLSTETRERMWASVPFEETTIDAIQGYGIGWTVDEQDGHRRVWHSGGGKARSCINRTTTSQSAHQPGRVRRAHPHDGDRGAVPGVGRWEGRNSAPLRSFGSATTHLGIKSLRQ